MEKTRALVGSKKDVRPQYGLSAANMRTLNYEVCRMGTAGRALTFLAGFAIGAAVGYLFYGGIGRDASGEPTALTYALNVLFGGGAGICAGFAGIPIRERGILRRRFIKLSRQFRDMLESLNTSLGAGKNVRDSFSAVYEDLKAQYEEDAYILRELEVILSGIANNIDIEDLLEDFGRRSGNADIASFAGVFRVCGRRGGDIKDAVRSTHEILSDKLEIREEIETAVTSSKTEQSIMMVMPVALIFIVKVMSPDFASNFTSAPGIAATTVAIALFVAAYFVGRAVLDIKI
ncbi:MAG: type II secretion system F family protein [Oscillospiraceae bacterium]|jgi:tight adherence protein B|nr:type II secretion system F family protein [Oscillospiraceae bacterium]